MPGLFGTIDLGARALQTQRQGVDVAGHNIANVNNPNYARQRLQVETSSIVNTQLGPMGTGADAASIAGLRNTLLDQQIQSETSVGGYLEAQQSALQSAQDNLAQNITTSGSSSGGVSAQNGLARGLTDLFKAFQSLSSDASSVSDRQVLLLKAADLASQFNQTDKRLGELRTQLNDSVQTGVTSANELLSSIASLNGQISRAEASSNGTANDLRDLRQEKIESLAKLVNVSVAADSTGSVDISIGGVTFVSGKQVLDSLEAYDAGGGQMLVRSQTSGTALTLTGGSIAGTIDARDGGVASLRKDLNTLASQLIAEVNTIHRAGFNLSGGTGADFFSGTGAGDIQVNPALVGKPALVQASGVAGAPGNNQTVLALAQLGNKAITGLNGQTFTQSYGLAVADLGQALSSANTRVDDQQSLQTLLARQRDSVSGVSLDEEMTDMMKYQKAFEASARLLSVVNDMVDSVLKM
jgi:flagellar hook-associated protein 1